MVSRLNKSIAKFLYFLQKTYGGVGVLVTIDYMVQVTHLLLRLVVAHLFLRLV